MSSNIANLQDVPSHNSQQSNKMTIFTWKEKTYEIGEINRQPSYEQSGNILIISIRKAKSQRTCKLLAGITPGWRRTQSRLRRRRGVGRSEHRHVSAGWCVPLPLPPDDDSTPVEDARYHQLDDQGHWLTPHTQDHPNYPWEDRNYGKQRGKRQKTIRPHTKNM